MAAWIFISFLVLCGTWLAHATVSCRATGPGRFAEPADDNCKNYTLCIYVKDSDSFIAYNAVCPSESVFDPNTSKCTSPINYTCNKRKIVTTKPTQSKICTSDGYIADHDYTNCSTYIQCVNISGDFTQMRLACPEGTYFDPNTTLCEMDYQCEDFTCSLPGRFANTWDFTCRKYYYCVPLHNGTYAQFEYTCPGVTMFNPKTKLCTSNYECN